MRMHLNVYAIKKLIAEKRLTCKELGRLTGISPQNISSILRRGTCYIKTGSLLADALGVEIEEIWKEEGV